MRADSGGQEESDRDRPLEREQWLRLGRRVPGEAAAGLRYKAYQQKMALRAQRPKAEAVRVSAETSSATSATSSTANTTATTATWVALGPAPMLSDPTGGQSYGFVSGRATRVLIDQTDPTGNTVYLGGAYGGLWKSTNAAAATASAVLWTPLIDDQPTLAVGAIAISPANNNILLVGTGEPNSSADSYYGLGILRSINGGASWTLIGSAGSGAYPFKGLGFSHIVFSSSNPNAVVAASAATNGSQSGAAGPNSVRGLYYSTDAGTTWSYATITDGSTSITPGSATSVVYNASLQKFFAAVRYHGVYTSTDGAHWSRLATQAGGTLLASSVCSPMTNSNCPLYRGELAVVPGSATMFLWVVDNTDKNRGIYETTDGGASWTALDVGGINSCGDSAGCGSAQGGYNLALAAVPTGGSAIDLYAGAVNLFKCSMTSTTATCAGAWKNLTHAYGCTPLAKPSHVHPDQHDIDFSRGNSNIMYFANDGGVYRTLNAAGLTSGSCSTANPFDNLNGSLGSMTEYVSFSQGTDAETLLGGTQDNGSPATNSVHSTATWTEVNGGDGGFNAINPNAPQQWLTANTDVSIQRCDSGFSCTADQFPVTVGSTQVGNDHGDFYAPFILDPQMTDNVIVGTCRVWRGPSDGNGWSGSNALSGSLTGDALPCSGSPTQVIRAVAAGGPADATGSRVIYAGTAAGQIYVSSDATSSSPTFSRGNISVVGFPISDIAIDPNDASGMTAWATVMGFGVGHVFRTHDGIAWQDVSSNLPDSPANSVLIDPSDPATVYVGTDIGVFITRDGGTTWFEYGPSSGSGFLPSTPVTRLRAFLGSSPRKLRASTYGRGIWEADMATVVPGFALAALPSVAIFKGQTAAFNGTVTAVGGYSSTVAVTCTGATVPKTCSGGSFVPSAHGTAFSVTANSPTIGDVAFTINAAGADAASTTRQAPALLRVVDFSLQPVPATVTVSAGLTATLSGINLTAAGSFDGNVTVTCDPSSLPAGASCSSSTAQPTANAPVTTSVAILTPTSTQPGTYSVKLVATSDVPGGTRAQTFTLTVLAAGTADFALTGTAVGATTISRGQSATFNINVSSLGSSFNNAVALSCGPLPDQTTCTFNNANVTPGAGGGTSTLTIATAGATRASAAPNPLPWSALWLAMPLAGVLMGSGRARRSRAIMLLVLLAVLATMHIACGGGAATSTSPSTNTSVKAGTPSGSYTVTVQGVAGSLTHSTTVSFTVK